MTRWQSSSVPGPGDYDERWAAMVRRGESVHGEADLVSWFEPASVLDAGCGTGRVAIELDRRGVAVVGVDLDAGMLSAARSKAPQVRWILGDISSIEVLSGGDGSDTSAGSAVSSAGERLRFDVVVMAGNVMVFVEPGTEAAVLANMARHLAPAGRLVAGFQLGRSDLTLADYDRFATAAGLALEHRWSTWDREPYDGGDYAVSVHRAAR